MKKTLLTLIVACCFIQVSIAQTADTITTASGLKYIFTKKGNGPAVKPGWLAIWHYNLHLTNGTLIDDSRARNAPLSSEYNTTHLIKGFTEALNLMHIGDRGIFVVPPAIGYGAKGAGKMIPPNSTLIFDIELIDTKEKSLQTVLDSVIWGKPARTDSIPHTAEALKTFAKLKKEKFGNLYVSEEDLNTIGYSLIKKHPNDAIEFFKLYVAMYPKSANAYDSLGEGYMTAGNKDKAISNYQKSLKLNPKNTNAEDMIKKLKMQ